MKISLLVLLIVICCDTVFGVIDHIFIAKDFSSNALATGLVKHLTMIGVIMVVYLLGDLPSMKFIKVDIDQKAYGDTVNALMSGICYVIGAGQCVSLITHIADITGYTFKTGIFKQEQSKKDGENKNDTL